jgi:hypothetical protein
MECRALTSYINVTYIPSHEGAVVFVLMYPVYSAGLGILMRTYRHSKVFS